MSDLGAHLGITPTAALAVVVATTVLYTSFVVATRLLGQRILTGLSTFDVAVVIVLGAVLGRATLGNTPTLAGGLVALATLFALEGVFGRLRATAAWERVVAPQPVLLMAGTTVLTDHLERFHITESDLRSTLRQSGVRNDDEVAAVVLEPTGQISVLTRGFLVDPAMLTGVRGADRMPSDLLGI